MERGAAGGRRMGRGRAVGEEARGDERSGRCAGFDELPIGAEDGMEDSFRALWPVGGGL